MKKLFTLFAMMFLLVGGLFAQKLSYQAVVRDNDNKLVVNTALTVEVSILNANNGVQYAETHNATSNQNGLIVLTIGEGTVTSGTNLSAVNWEGATINSVIKNGGTTVATISSPVNAVPYALQAANASGSFSQVQADWAETNTASKAYIANKPDLNSFITTETDPNVPAWAKEADKPVYQYSEIQNTPTIPTTVASLTDAADYAKVADMNTALGAKADTAAVKAALNGKADANNVYTKAETDNLLNDKADAADVTTALAGKADASNVYTKTEADNLLNAKANATDVTTALAGKADANNVYTKTEADNLLSAKANAADVTTALAEKANVTDVYNKAQVDQKLDAKANLTDIHNSTITINQNGAPVGSFTLNQTGDQTINLAGGSGSSATQTININGNVISLTPGGGSVTLPDETDPVFTAWDKNYDDLSNKPTIPTTVAQLTDAGDYVTDAELAAAGYLTSYTETDPTIKAWAKADTKPTYDYSEIQNTPAIPAAQVQADWAEDNTASMAYIANKPAIPANTSDLNNDAGFITAQDITGYATQSALNDSVADLKAQMNQISSQLNQLMTALTALQVTSKRFVATAEQTQFNLGQAVISEIVCYVNGVMVGSKTSGVITVSGNTVTYVPAQNYNYKLQAGDVVTFMYIANN